MAKLAKRAVIRGRIKGYMAAYGKTADDMAVKMRLTRSAWYRRLRHPEKFTVEELERLELVTGLELLAGGKE